MSNYTKSTNFATKDNLPTGDPLKIVKGTEIDTEFNNIATAISTKTDNASAAITGGSITGITDLAIADGGTGASTATAAINNLLPSQTSNANKYLQTDGTNVSWDAISINTGDITGTLAVANGGTGVTSSTGTGSVVLSNSPTLVTPSLGAATASTLDVSGNVTLSGGTANSIPYLNGSKVVTTGTELYFNGTNLGVGASASYRVDLGSATSDDAAVGIRIGRGGSSTTWSLIDNVGGSGNYRQYSSGTPTLRWLTSTNGTSWSEQMRLNATGLGVGNNNPTEKLDVTGSALVSGSVTASQFYGSFNGAIGNTTAYSGAFTSLTTSSTVTINGGTANGVAYLNGSKVLTTSSVIKFDGTNFTSDRSASTAYSGTNQATWANGIVLNNSATPATGILDSIYFSNNANMQNVFGVAQNASGYGDFVWAGYSGTYTEWMKLTSSGLTLTSNPTLSGGTANGVTYLNGSKVLTSGSALTFDGTTLGVTGGFKTFNSAAGGPVDSIYTGTTAGSVLGQFRAYGTGSGVTAESTFRTVLDGGSITSANFQWLLNNSEQMRLTSTGLGIGTSSPAYKLDVTSSALTVANFTRSGAGATSLLRLTEGSGGYVAIGCGGGTSNMSFRPGGTELMLLDSAGNLGLGVTPSAWTSLIKAFETSGGSLYQYNGATLGMAQNAYYDGASWKYKNTAAASSYFQSGSVHYWNIAPSGTAGNAISFTQAMTLDASGNLGVGTTLPQTKLTLAKGSGNVAPTTITGANAFANIGYAEYGAASNGKYMISFGYFSGATNAPAYIGLEQTATGSYTKGDLTFYTRDVTTDTAPTERARITSAGDLLVGTTSSAYASSGRTIIESYGSSESLWNLRGGSTNLYIQKTSTESYIQASSGSIYVSSASAGVYLAQGATSWTANSDERLKTFLTPFENPLQKICSLRSGTGRYLADEEGVSRSFLIAQDVQAVLPEAIDVQSDEIGTLGLRYTDTIPLLVAAIQELKAEFDAYKASHP